MNSIGGAQQLAKILEARRPAESAPRVVALEAVDALPLFHWVGVEPLPAETTRLDAQAQIEQG